MHSPHPQQHCLLRRREWKAQVHHPSRGDALQHAQDPLDDDVSFADAFYSFGINYPDAITNSNYPNFLCNLTTPDGLHRDMGTIDLLRDRERGVPR